MWAFLLFFGICLAFYLFYQKINTKPDFRYKREKKPTLVTPPITSNSKSDPRYASTRRRGSLEKEDTYTENSVTTPMQNVQPELDDIQYAWRTGDFDTARRLLQQHAYTMKSKDVTDRERAEFTSFMTAFASEDPLYKIIIKPIKTVVAAEPGIIQSNLSKRLTAYGANIETIRYVLYFAHELNDIHRVKHGRSYKLYPPGVTVDQEKSPPDIANN